MTLEARRNKIVEKLSSVREDWILRSIEHLLSAAGAAQERRTTHEPSGAVDLARFTGNYYKKFDLDELIRERPPIKLDREAWAKEVDALEWDQSIEELLEDLK